MTSTNYLKADLIAELAEKADVTKQKAEILVSQLVQIACREARKGFTLPGLCRLDVARRKSRRVRIPSSGQWILIGEHDALRVRPLKKAKHAVAPMMPGLVQMIDAPEAASSEAPAPAAPAPAAPAAAPTDNPEGLVSFRCGACGQEIEAPFDMAGTASECPACGGGIEVPYVSEPGTIWGRAAPEAKPPALPAMPAAQTEAAPRADAAAPHTEAHMSRTIRIELPDDV